MRRIAITLVLSWLILPIYGQTEQATPKLMVGLEVPSAIFRAINGGGVIQPTVIYKPYPNLRLQADYGYGNFAQAPKNYIYNSLVDFSSIGHYYRFSAGICPSEEDVSIIPSLELVFSQSWFWEKGVIELDYPDDKGYQGDAYRRAIRTDWLSSSTLGGKLNIDIPIKNFPLRFHTQLMVQWFLSNPKVEEFIPYYIPGIGRGSTDLWLGSGYREANSAWYGALYISYPLP
jgi:hypothetical protein